MFFWAKNLTNGQKKLPKRTKKCPLVHCFCPLGQFWGGMWQQQRQWPNIPRRLGNEDEVAEKEVLETTAAEWQGVTAAIGLGLWWWRSTALSPPEPVG